MNPYRKAVLSVVRILVFGLVLWSLTLLAPEIFFRVARKKGLDLDEEAAARGKPRKPTTPIQYVAYSLPAIAAIGLLACQKKIADAIAGDLDDDAPLKID